MTTQEEWWRGRAAQKLYWGAVTVSPFEGEGGSGYDLPVLGAGRLLAAEREAGNAAYIRLFAREWGRWRKRAGNTLKVRKAMGRVRLSDGGRGDDGWDGLRTVVDPVWFP